MLVQDAITKTLVQINDVLGAELVKSGAYVRARRVPSDGAGPSLGGVMDPLDTIIPVPAEVTVEED